MPRTYIKLGAATAPGLPTGCARDLLLFNTPRGRFSGDRAIGVRGECPPARPIVLHGPMHIYIFSYSYSYEEFLNFSCRPRNWRFAVCAQCRTKARLISVLFFFALNIRLEITEREDGCMGGARPASHRWWFDARLPTIVCCIPFFATCTQTREQWRSVVKSSPCFIQPPHQHCSQLFVERHYNEKERANDETSVQ